MNQSETSQTIIITVCCHLRLILLLFLHFDILSVDCLNPDHFDRNVLSWIFTEEFVWNCFETVMRTTDKRVKRSICNFMNMVCGSDVDDVSSVDSQCECLLNAIVVCPIYSSHYC